MATTKEHSKIKQGDKMIDRLINDNPNIYIFDLDGTIIDSSHRINFLPCGSLDLEKWKEKSTKENIFNDTLLPLYSKLNSVYKNGDIVILCTAREMGKWDYEFIFTHGIFHDKIISRPKGNNLKDHTLKAMQLHHFWQLRPYRDKHKIFYDDNMANCRAIDDLGNRYAKYCKTSVYNAQTINESYLAKYEIS